MPWNASIIESEILAVHAALVPSGSLGEIVLFGGDEHWADQQESAGGGKFKKTRIYDVATHSIVGVTPPSPDSDVFCSHHAFAADGRLLIGGGTSKWPEGGDAHHHDLDFLGHRRCWLYNARARTWVETARYNKNPDQPDEEHSGGRWYPGLVTLGNGDVVSFFGHLEQNDFRHRNTLPERYSLAANSWINLPKVMAIPIEPGGDVRFLFFARVFQLPDGKLFFATPMPVDFAGPVIGDGPYFSTRYDPATGDYVGAKIAEPAPGGYHDWSRTAVLLPLLPSEDYRPRVLFAGDTTAIKIDLGAGIATPAWQNTAARAPAVAALTRTYSYCVLLPTGQVCVVGGVSAVNPEQGVQEVEVYDPGINWTTGQYGPVDAWAVKESGSFVRNYHCTALLLPNGKVWVAGGDHNAASGDPNIVGVKKIELYEPEYIAVDGRIQIQDAPILLVYGQQFDVTIDRSAANVRCVALMRNGSATHSTNNDQRYVGLSFTPDFNTLKLAAPPNGNVAPPGYYMLWVIDMAGNPCEQASFVRLAHVSCEAVTDLSTYSEEQVQSLGGGGAATFANALYVNFGGFIDNELVGAPSFALTWADTNAPISTGDLTLVSTGRWREVDPPPPDTTQRITFPFQVKFLNMNVFGAVTDTRQVRVKFTLGVHTCSQTIDLTKSPNPYMLDINPAIHNDYWLSTDVRVFNLTAGDSRFGVFHGEAADAPQVFLKGVLDRFHGPSGAGLFASILEGEDASPLDLATVRLVSMTPPFFRGVFNYAVAKVRYRAVTTAATNVKVFFRLFNVEATGLEYNTHTVYRNSNLGPSTVPLLGVAGGEIASIPFFLSPRVNTLVGSGGNSMITQTLDPVYEVRTITPTAGVEVTAYFGCWLDINRTEKHFPLSPGGTDGPWMESSCKTMLELVRGRHMCVVAEVYFEPDPTAPNETPGTSDNLAQRNLAILHSDNPGAPGSHTVLQTFEIKPSTIVFKEPPFVPAVAIGGPIVAAPAAHKITRPDELLFRWHNLPRDSEVTVYFSDITTADILMYAALRLSPPAFEVVDKHTIRFTVADDTWMPIPGGRELNIPALLSVKLPDTIVYGQQFRISVHQVSGATNRVIGSFEIVIPVSKAELIVDEEIRTLSVMKYVAASILPGNRWYDIFKRYISGLSVRVDALGGDSKTVFGNPDGSGNPYVAPPPQPAVKPCYPGWATSLVVALLLFSAGLTNVPSWLIGTAVVGVVLLAILIGYWARQCRCHVWCSVLDYVALGSAAATLGLLALGLAGGGGAFFVPALVTAAVLTALMIVLSFVLGCRGECCEGPCEHCGETKGRNPTLNWWSRRSGVLR